MPNFISTLQSALVPKRLIRYNILMAYELVHFLRQKRAGKNCLMSLKLDISKTYDRMELRFLKIMMKRMGFDEK